MTWWEALVPPLPPSQTPPSYSSNTWEGIHSKTEVKVRVSMVFDAHRLKNAWKLIKCGLGVHTESWPAYNNYKLIKSRTCNLHKHSTATMVSKMTVARIPPAMTTVPADIRNPLHQHPTGGEGTERVKKNQMLCRWHTAIHRCRTKWWCSFRFELKYL